MNTIVRFRLRQQGGDARWQNSRVFQAHEPPEYPETGEFVSAPESAGGVECVVTELTEVMNQEIDDGSKGTIITVILRRSGT